MSELPPRDDKSDSSRADSGRATMALYWTRRHESLLKEAADAKKFAEEAGAVFTPSHAALKSRDWTEDADHENGNYSCWCTSCESAFIGHKRRTTCKLCALSTTPQKTLATHITDESLERINDLHKIVRDNARSDYHDAMEKFQNLVGVMWENIYSRCAGTTASATPRSGDAEDAARYRWLRDLSVPPHNFYIAVPDEFKDERYTPQQVDAAIDAAMRRPDSGKAMS